MAKVMKFNKIPKLQKNYFNEICSIYKQLKIFTINTQRGFVLHTSHGLME